MGYIEDPSMVRVDFFDTSGKWRLTVSMKWDRYWSEGEDGDIEFIDETFKRCLTDQFYNLYVRDKLIAVCLEPYHEHSFPLMARYDIIGA